MEPRLIHVWVDEGAARRASLVAKTGGEGLVEPEVVPPLHGDEVTEPHMAKLVLDNDGEEGKLWDGHVLFRAHNLIGVRDAANVLHGTVLVIRAHDVVHLRERISCVEVLLVELQSRLGDTEDELMAEELDERLSDEDALRHIHRVVVLEDLVRAGAQGVQV